MALPPKKQQQYLRWKATQRSRLAHGAIVRQVVENGELISAYRRFLHAMMRIELGHTTLSIDLATGKFVTKDDGRALPFLLSLEQTVARMCDKSLGDPSFLQFRGRELFEECGGIMPKFHGRPFRDVTDLAEFERQMMQHQACSFTYHEDGTISVDRRDDDYSSVCGLIFTRKVRDGSA
jgi:hypothetical protein